MNEFETRYVQVDIWQVQVFLVPEFNQDCEFSADDFRFERSMFIENLKEV